MMHWPFPHWELSVHFRSTSGHGFRFSANLLNAQSAGDDVAAAKNARINIDMPAFGGRAARP